MDLTTKLRRIDLHLSFITGSGVASSSTFLDANKSSLLPFSTIKASNFPNNFQKYSKPTTQSTQRFKLSTISSKLSSTSKLSSIAVENSETNTQNREEIEALLSKELDNEYERKRGNKQSNSGASSVSSRVRLENISRSYKGVTVLKDVNWEVKRGKSRVSWGKWGRKNYPIENNFWVRGT